MITETFLAAGAIMLVSLVGVVFTSRLARRWLHNNLGILTIFAAGVFTVTVINLVQEGIHLVGITWAITLTLAGFVLFWLGNLLVPEVHHHHDDDCHHDTGSRRHAWRVLLGDGLHNIGDGLVLVPAFLVSPVLGIVTTISIFVHELIQEVAEYFILREAGYSSKQALIRNFVVSTTILVGVAIGLVTRETSLLQGIFLTVSAGGFAYVVIHDLIGNRTILGPKRAWAIPSFILGVLLILGVNWVLPHVHAEDDDHAEEAPSEHLEEASFWELLRGEDDH